jgi:hypothetical protein
MGRDGVVKRTVEPTQHPAVGQLRKERLDRIVEVQHTILNQEQGHRRDHRLRIGADAHERVDGHRAGPVRFGLSDGGQGFVISMQDAHNSARDFTLLHQRADPIDNLLGIHSSIVQRSRTVGLFHAAPTTRPRAACRKFEVVIFPHTSSGGYC